MINIKETPFGSGEYGLAKLLRDEVLRRPLNMLLSEKDIAGEEAQIHIVAMDNDHVVGTVILKPLSPARVKIRQMAISTAYQGKGMGKAVMQFAENTARQKGFIEAEMSARVYAQQFYEKLGYRATGEVFIEVTLPTIKMVKIL